MAFIAAVRRSTNGRSALRLIDTYIIPLKCGDLFKCPLSLIYAR